MSSIITLLADSLSAFTDIKKKNVLIEKFKSPATAATAAPATIPSDTSDIDTNPYRVTTLKVVLLFIVFINWFLGAFACAYHISTTPFSTMDFKLIALTIIFGFYGYIVYIMPY